MNYEESRALDKDPDWIAIQDETTRETNILMDLELLAETYGLDTLSLIPYIDHLNKVQKGAFERQHPAQRGVCVDCGYVVRGVDWKDMHEYYNVHDDVWAASGLGPKDGMLCIGCLEDRIGRLMNKDDFGLCQINTHPGYLRSDRFLDRLNRSADGEQVEVEVS